MNRYKCGSLTKAPRIPGKESNWPSIKKCQLPCQLWVLPGFTNWGNQRVGISQSVSSDSDCISSSSLPFCHVLFHLALQKYRSPETIALVGKTEHRNLNVALIYAPAPRMHYAWMCYRYPSLRWTLHSLMQRDVGVRSAAASGKLCRMTGATLAICSVAA